MTDRRERVAEAIWCARHGQDTPSLMWDSDLYKRMADAALAVIDAEPTEAEIIAAREMWFRLPDDMTTDECMRRVLIAARKARP